jgi:mono/diheme cytochrome c family protein
MDFRGIFGCVAGLSMLACASEAARPTPPAIAAPVKAAPDAEVLERGKYLVSHVAACAGCHSPRRADRTLDPELWLSGIDCLLDVAPADPNVGCLNSRNLTNHETGLKNRSDREIKDMFLHGVRPDGKALHPMMPYAFYGNMREADADAIIAYLRTVPGIDRQVARNQPPFDRPLATPEPNVPDAKIPLPRADYADRDAAMRGRYLAGSIGTCLSCHTPKVGSTLDLAKAFQGGQTFTREGMKLPPTFPEVIYTSNLTPDVTGIRGYSLADIVRAVKHGEDKNQGGERLCPPMPAGPVGAFGGLTDADTMDIGHYLLSLPPAHNPLPDCSTSGLQQAAAQTKQGPI